jgi:3-deoxy-7-phosphoheptulonate synthase/chorismate mutase
MILVQNRRAPLSGNKQGAALSLIDKGVTMESDWKKKLGEYRDQINEIDKKLVDLLNDRAVVVMKVKKLKQKENLPLYDARREEELVESIVEYNKGPLYRDNIIQIFENILRNVQILEKDENL